jgi:uncharacterized protein (DUF1330 family)
MSGCCYARRSHSSRTPPGVRPVESKCTVSNEKEVAVAKGYWVTSYRKILNPEGLAAYAKLATPAIQDGGGRFLVRGVAVYASGVGLQERTVVIEFDSLESAISTYKSDAYQAAIAALGNAVERDFRIVEGAE